MPMFDHEAREVLVRWQERTRCACIPDILSICTMAHEYAFPQALEQKTVTRVYNLIREGKINEAEAYCHEHDESWRVASINGGRAWGIEVVEGECEISTSSATQTHLRFVSRYGYGEFGTRSNGVREHASRSVEEDVQGDSQ
jgi:hypothetical protein